MIRLMLVDNDGKAITPQDLATVAELREAAERARTLIRECEQLAQLKTPRTTGVVGMGVPYRT